MTEHLWTATVSASGVAIGAGVTLMMGLVIAVYLMQIGPGGLNTLYLALSGAGLAFFYSADLFSLKQHGLGDVAIFLSFGPLLMEGVAVSVTGKFSVVVGLHSLPIGL